MMSLKSAAFSRVIWSIAKTMVQIIVIMKTSTMMAPQVSPVRSRLRRRFLRTSENSLGKAAANTTPATIAAAHRTVHVMGLLSTSTTMLNRPLRMLRSMLIMKLAANCRFEKLAPSACSTRRSLLELRLDAGRLRLGRSGGALDGGRRGGVAFDEPALVQVNDAAGSFRGARVMRDEQNC